MSESTETKPEGSPACRPFALLGAALFLTTTFAIIPMAHAEPTVPTVCVCVCYNDPVMMVESCIGPPGPTGLCSGEQVGVVVDGTQACTGTPHVCQLPSIGLQPSCVPPPNVDVCNPPSTVGAIVNGVGTCAPTSLPPCPANQVGTSPACVDPCLGLSRTAPMVVNELGVIPAGYPTSAHGVAIIPITIQQYLQCIVGENPESKVQNPLDWQAVPAYSPEKIVPTPSADMAIPYVSARSYDPVLTVVARGTSNVPTIHINVIAASDDGSFSGNRPQNGCNLYAVDSAVSRMEDDFAFTTHRNCWVNVGWFPPCCDSSDILFDLVAWANPDDWGGFEWYGSGTHKYLFGWVALADNNGIQQGSSGQPAIGAEHTTWRPEWQNTEIFQHEMSHEFGAIDNGLWCTEGTGIMNYCHAYWGDDSYDENNYHTLWHYFRHLG